ncbi:MAG: hypothetical protein ACRD2U_01990 [Terriglobales bacterium]
MKPNTIKRLPALAFASLLALLLAVSGLSQAEDYKSDAKRLEGTWIVQVTQHDCASGAALGSPFLSLLTFARGGTMTETTSNPMIAPPVFRGPGHGVWSYKGGDTYRASTIALITVNGVLAKTQVITQRIEMGDNPDEFTTPKASVHFYDPTGKLLMTGCATAVGKRFE